MRPVSIPALLAAFSFALVVPGLAQTPPPPAKRLPPAGIAIAEKDRAALTAGAVALRAEIDGLRRAIAAGDERKLALLADVEMFEKAVDWALRYDEFFAPKEVAFARHLLDEGHERVAHFNDATPPWLTATGLIVRGYRSTLDGSVQPYGLVVPKAWRRDQPGRLQVWLLGRGEKRTELAFLAEREGKAPEIAPANTLVLIPYGRFCNATKFAGEVDVFEAMTSVRRDYMIDPLRTSVAGFSMGGASVWHLATHHSGLWSSASPGAGFADTAIYSKAFDPKKTPPPEWEQTLWHWYNALDVAGNLFNCPTVAYSGEIDPQKQSADLMEAAMAKEGLKLERFIGPNTAHKYEPATREKLVARLEELAGPGRAAQPREVRLTTYSLRYGEASWVRILGMEKSWERTDVRAQISEDGKSIHADTKNVRALRLTPLNEEPHRAIEIVIDGQKLDSPLASDRARTLVKTNDHWEFGYALSHGGELTKSPGVAGPIDDAFMDAFVYVRPTGQPLNAKVGDWTAKEMAHATKMWRDIFRGDAPVQDDAAMSEQELAGKNLVLWGDPASNTILARILPRLPLTWTKEKIVFRGQTYDAAHHAPILIFPNPINPAHYVVLNSGMDFRDDAYGSNALQTPKLPDYAIIDLDTPPGPRWPGKIATAGFFDETWK